jgi:hypothetical protein
VIGTWSGLSDYVGRKALMGIAATGQVCAQCVRKPFVASEAYLPPILGHRMI